MDKSAKALAAVLLLTIGGLVLAWQGQLAWTHGFSRASRSMDASMTERDARDAQNSYLHSGDVPGEALYGWSYPFAFPHDPLAAVQNPNGGGLR